MRKDQNGSYSYKCRTGICCLVGKCSFPVLGLSNRSPGALLPLTSANVTALCLVPVSAGAGSSARTPCPGSLQTPPCAYAPYGSSATANFPPSARALYLHTEARSPLDSDRHPSPCRSREISNVKEQRVMRDHHAEKTAQRAHVEGRSLNPPLPFLGFFCFSFSLFLFFSFLSPFPLSFPLFHASLLLSTLLPSSSTPTITTTTTILSSSVLPPFARSCKWLPANGLSEEKTDLNEEWRQKREQRGSKRR